MKLEDQVAPLALAQRMKELGFPQETEFEWVGDGTERWVGHGYDSYADMEGKTHGSAECAAPTVAEIGEALPATGNTSNYLSLTQIVSRNDDGSWSLGDYGPIHTPTDPSGLLDIEIPGGKFPTEAEARARLWIALAEAGALKP